MKSYLKLLLKLSIVALLCFGFAAFADPSPSPSPASVLAAVPTSLNGWLALLAPVAVAVLDFVFAINSKAKANGLLHWLFLLVGGKETPPASS